jgi:tRNA 2-thiouridine synthesizing protein A
MADKNPVDKSRSEIQVDVRGETCPVPLVEVRKALRKASPGDIIQVVGTHPSSKKEIPMAVEALRMKLVSVEGTDTDWKIVIQR